MSTYGVQPTGYVRKPISVILAELEAGNTTEFGPGVIQTPQSPLGQLNGLMADLLAEVDERNLDLYQSYDPDQAEGTRLDTLARLRLVLRGNRDDAAFRKVLTNVGQGRIDTQDLAQVLHGLPGVTYAQVFVNDGDAEELDLEKGSVAVAVIGGDDDEVAAVIRRYVVPGVNMFGNLRISTTQNGYCRSVSIIRPSEVVVDVVLNIRVQRDRLNCPAPSASTIGTALENLWMESRVNGKDVSYFNIRSVVESAFSNVEVVTFTGKRETVQSALNITVGIGFTEIASLNVIAVNVL